ncbi:CLUMA_CG021162, isoform A [Clunio marinus]|uniref:CLUMA_CG021162, isoform A n=1 Tax=Clunio marinus TaxID=568069 RepID=A0A1J1J7H3_9DIPT|nr:CLUMA_CG021162, isoform A [Clunio marinus]
MIHVINKQGNGDHSGTNTEKRANFIIHAYACKIPEGSKIFNKATTPFTTIKNTLPPGCRHELNLKLYNKQSERRKCWGVEVTD